MGLIDELPPDLTAKAKFLMHGDGRTHWFDKSLCMFVFPDGGAGLNAEHSLADAPAFGHIWESSITKE